MRQGSTTTKWWDGSTAGNYIRYLYLDQLWVLIINNLCEMHTAKLLMVHPDLKLGHIVQINLVNTNNKLINSIS